SHVLPSRTSDLESDEPHDPALDDIYPLRPLQHLLYKDTAATELYPLSLHDALPICPRSTAPRADTRWSSPAPKCCRAGGPESDRSEEHTSELQSRGHLVCRLLLEKKKFSL